MKLLLDEHYANEIAERLRADRYDAETGSDRALKGLDDEALLTVCAREARALLTNNARDFVPLARAWAATGREHAGIVLTADASLPRHRGAIGHYVAALAELMAANLPDRALADQLSWLN